MTLQNGLVWKRRAYLWCDTAVADTATGAIVGHASKAMTGLGWPWAAVHSGELRTDDLAAVAGHIGKAHPTNETELIEACRVALHREADEGRIGRLLVAYACRHDGARMFFMATDDTAAGPAFMAHPTVQHACSPASDLWNNRFVSSEFTVEEMRGFIASQIEQPNPTVYGYPATYGGNLIEVRVTGAGVRPTLRGGLGFI